MMDIGTIGTPDFYGKVEHAMLERLDLTILASCSLGERHHRLSLP